LRDGELMRRALRLARRGLGRVEPNPMVGCVLARDGVALAEGWHRGFGRPHAEAEALARCRDAGRDPAGCDVYVTLEPCSHHGKTPPCTDALIAAGVRRVVIATRDPNPAVAGGGAARLRDGGVAVEVGLGAGEANELNEAYVKRVTTGLPWVIAKWAQTLDGRTATASGDSKWISGESSRRVVHQLRGRVDAVMVGIGTALADDPALTARGVPVRRRARRVVVDRDLKLPMDAKLIASLRKPVAQPAPPVTVAVSEKAHATEHAKRDAMAALGVEVVALPVDVQDLSRLSLRHLLAHLASTHGATNVLVEGGASLVGSLLRAKLVDQVIAFVAPMLVGDAAALGAVTGLACERIADAQRLTLRRLKRWGDDVMLDYRVVKG